MNITELQKKTIKAIVNIFETGSVLGNYSQVTLLQGDTGGLTYGKSQVTLNSGNLYLLIADYISQPGAQFASQFQPYINRLFRSDNSLNNDMPFRKLLQDSGKDPVMQRTQDAFFDRVFFDPAYNAARNYGITYPLGVCIVYDGFIHGSFRTMRQRTEANWDIKKIGELLWVQRYVDTRRNWLANHNNMLLRNTVYRMDAFRDLFTTNNWNLNLPITVRGRTINANTLNVDPTSVPTTTDVVRASAESPSDLRVLRYGMRGDDVRLAQECLNQILNTKLVEDGVFGKITLVAILAFQYGYKIKIDGIVGNVTWEKLEQYAPNKKEW